MSSLRNILKNVLFTLIFITIILLLFITHKMKSFVVPIFIAFFTSLVIQPFIEKLHKTKIPNWLSTVIVVSAAILVVAIILTVFGLSFGSFVVDFTKSGGIAENFQENIITFVKDLSKIELIKDHIDQERINKIVFDTAAAIVSIENFKNYISVNITSEKLSVFEKNMEDFFLILDKYTGLSGKIKENGMNTVLSEYYAANTERDIIFYKMLFGKMPQRDESAVF